eukprot:TRINITY_DN6207_c0_g3_i2.p2 TRINITY_DN6207_c0_g3~~TRINITY_DN6207_c0_g3_i2.p2  ORF type:complete len:206 (-),score=62.90 TRINITY_DN6207_c0_g3_i2:420-986(-)
MCIRDRSTWGKYPEFFTTTKAFSKHHMFVEGSWKGEGKVVDSINYFEEASFTKVRETCFSYNHRTKTAEGKPMHAESGFLRLFPEAAGADSGKAELLLCHPFGVCEIEEGIYTKDRVELKTTGIIRTGTAKEPFVTELRRIITLAAPNNLKYTVDMGTTKYETKPHLEASLLKQEQIVQAFEPGCLSF